MKTPTKFFYLTLILLLSACTPSPPPPIEEIPVSREATFGEVENIVEVRPKTNDDPEPAKFGQTLFIGGSAQSGEDGRARLDLTPEGTTIRLAPNSHFTLEELTDDLENPSTQLELLSGQIWIILSGGELDVETSYGTASVRGSMMSVSFDSITGMLLSCFEGHCTLENDAGRVELDEGLASAISAMGEAPSSPYPICPDEIKKWKEADPEVESWLQGTPIAPPMPPPPPNDEGGNPPPSNQSTTYSLTNNCPEGNWHWEFVGPTTITFSIAPGGSKSGTLPLGDYTATDTLEGAGMHGPDFIPSGGNLEVLACPDQ